jgi:hypothetical protein
VGERRRCESAATSRCLPIPADRAFTPPQPCASARGTGRGRRSWDHRAQRKGPQPGARVRRNVARRSQLHVRRDEHCQGSKGHPAQLKQLRRHRSCATLAAYIEEGDLFEDNALNEVP